MSGIASLFLEAEQTELVHFRGEASTIPCRVTNPNANVTLLPLAKFGGSASKEVATYDPRIGFTLGPEVANYSGNVSCLAALGNETDLQSFVVDFVGE